MNLAWFSALVLPFFVAAALITLRDVVAAADIALVLALVILVAAVLGGRLTGIAAGVAAAVAFDVFFTRPYYSLRIDRAQDLETVVLMLVVGLATGEIVRRGERFRLAAQAARADLERASRITELAAGGERPGRLIRVARRELIDLLDLAECEFELPPFLDALPRLTHTGLLIPGSLGENVEPALHEATFELPVWAEGLELGRFVGTSGHSLLDIRPEARSAALLLADQLGLALRTRTTVEDGSQGNTSRTARDDEDGCSGQAGSACARQLLSVNRGRERRACMPLDGDARCGSRAAFDVQFDSRVTRVLEIAPTLALSRPRNSVACREDVVRFSAPSK